MTARILRTIAIAALLAGATLTAHLTLDGRAARAQGADPTAPTPPHAEGAGGDTAAVAPADEARRARTVARMGEVRITIGDVEDHIARQSPFMRARYRDPAQLRELVQNLIRFELLSREAERQGFGDDPEVREATAQSAVQQLVRERFDQTITPESIPQADVAAYYESHPGEFTRPEVRRASHVLLRTREDADQLLPQLREADARTFRAIAQERSLDAESRARGGDLRYFDREGHAPNSSDPGVEPAIVAAAFGLREVGDVSAPVEVGGQWSIVKLTGLRPAEHRTIEQAGPGIRLRLWRERRQAAIDSFVEGLRERAGVEVHYDRMRPIRMDPPERLGGEDEEGDEEGAGPEGDEGLGIRAHGARGAADPLETPDPQTP